MIRAWTAPVIGCSAPIQDSVKNACIELVKEHLIKSEKLTQEQIAEVIRQALECGDIMRNCVVGHDGGGQIVTYIPYREHGFLKQRIKELEAQLNGTFTVNDKMEDCEKWKNDPS